MKKIITLLLICFTVSFVSAQLDGTYYIKNPEKNRNTGKLVEQMYVQIKEHQQLGKVAVVSLKKGSYGITFMLDKSSSAKAEKMVFKYVNSFFVAYDEKSFISFDILGRTSEDALKIGRPNFFVKDKAELNSVTNKDIDQFAQEIYSQLKK